MKNNNDREYYSLDDADLQNHLASNLGSYCSSELVEQKDYSLESIRSFDEGFNISLRVENLYSSESYLVENFVA